MKKVNCHNSISKMLGFCLVVLLAFSTTVFAQDAAVVDSIAKTETDSITKTDAAPQKDGASDALIAEGKALFNTNCASCHKLDKKTTGPALRGVVERREKEWLYSWIQNNIKLRESGDADAIAIFEEYDGSPMNAFPQLSTADIDAILAYTSTEEPPKPPKPPVVEGEGEVDNSVLMFIFAGILLLLAVVLFMVTKKLKAIADAKGANVPEGNRIWDGFVKNQFLMIVLVVFFALFAAYHAFGYFVQLGVDQGYKPVQPIHFSHKIHAGDNGIDCKYCHSSARVSKTSGIPALNVCMNCHKGISEVAETTATADYSKEYYDGEIQKLYDAVGWKDFKYTGETKPVKWVRVHNLPDFAYFNHSQHVSVAGLQCQECHGPVEEMEILEQHAPLTMGWCIDCHKEKEVSVKGNDYYTKIHAELKKKYGVENFTVAQMGGLECGKCHY